MDKHALSDLCSSCHAERPKYRCPRCNAQTCSLSCSKRHKQRAACSGKRDPAVYVKKTQWATPTGIDRDYNYLKSVERNIDDASRNAHQRGIGHNSSKTAARGWQPASALQRYLTSNRIIVELAPRGMSRQISNQTRATKSGKIFWTVEWADVGGGRSVHHDCLESESIAALHAAKQIERQNLEDRELGSKEPNTEKRGIKRKRNRAHKEAQCDRGEDGSLEPQRAISDIKPEMIERRTVKIKPEPNSDADWYLESGAANPQDAEQDEAMKQEESDASSSSVRFILESEEATKPARQPNVATKIRRFKAHESADTKPDWYYYLRKSGTTSASHVLIPLKYNDSLTSSLTDHVVREYPTIFVLLNPPETLPAGYLLEGDYMRTLQMESSKTQRLPTLARGGEGQANTKVGEGHKDDIPGGLDPKSILDMLKRDITR